MHQGTPPPVVDVRRASTGQRFPQLDGLRAVAIVLVVAQHSLTAPTTKALRGLGLAKAAELLEFTTRSGVELFFVLSGVLLLRPYLRGARRFQTTSYLRRRVERLWPAYVVALFLGGIILVLPKEHPTWYTAVLPEPSWGSLLKQLGVVNLGWISYSGAWWSLSLEVAFYLLVPGLIAALFALRLRPSAFIGFGVLAVGASLIAASLLSTSADASGPSPADGRLAVLDTGEMIALFFIYLPCFAMGAILARFSGTSRLGFAVVFSGAGYCLLGLFVPVLNIHIGFALMYGGLVTSVLGGAKRLANVLSRPGAVWLGERSYSLFLVHFPLFYLINYLASFVVPDRNFAYFALSRGIGLPAAVLSAMALFWFIERRFARGLTTADNFWPPLRRSG